LTTAADEVDINPHLGEAAESCTMQARRRGVDLACELKPLPPCRQDPRHLERIVKNMVGFAINRIDAGAVSIRCGPNQNQIRIEVIDRGPDVSERDLAAQMVPPKTNGASGSARGLNLYIARQLAEASGGMLQVRRIREGELHLIAELPIQGQTAPPS